MMENRTNNTLTNMDQDAQRKQSLSSHCLFEQSRGDATAKSRSAFGFPVESSMVPEKSKGVHVFNQCSNTCKMDLSKHTMSVLASRAPKD